MCTWLSQWWSEHPFTDREGVRYPSAEHFMMAEKARLMDDVETLEKILTAEHPAEAKKLGRQVAPFDAKTWNEHKSAVVVYGNVFKFRQHEELKAYLLSTGDKVLVEASPRDRVWGIGLGKDNEAARDPRRWRGENLLGFALMEARAKLRAE